MDAISIRNVTKSFKKTTLKREYTSFKTEFVRWVTRKQRAEPQAATIDVIKGIDLVVPRGKTVGIVGRNGSGKSTLLKLVTGIYSPTSGTIDVNGRVSALLDLGAGFHPDFTGRENIMINGMILGMSRDEVIRRTPEIIAFSELGEFIDEPVRTYSSGMFMRLAFAVATHVDPDILIIDEILAVGDAHFSRKSRAKMNEFKRSGKTILLVTHELGTLQTWCDLAVWIDGGTVRQVGDPHQVVDAYIKAVALAEAQLEASGSSALSAPGLALPMPVQARAPEHGPQVGTDQRWGTFDVEMNRVTLKAANGAEGSTFTSDSAIELTIEYIARSELSDLGFGVRLLNEEGSELFATSTFDGSATPPRLPRSGTVRLQIERLGLGPGVYSVDVIARTRSGVEYDVHHKLHGFSVQANLDGCGVIRPPHRWQFGDGLRAVGSP